MTSAGAERDVQMMKDAGFDFIRGSHYPHAPAFSAGLRREGHAVLVGELLLGHGAASGRRLLELQRVSGESGDQAPFAESVKASLRDMIRIHRNHPSIIVWSMSNEPFISDKAVMPKVRDYLKNLVAETHKLDPTRTGGGRRMPARRHRQARRCGGYNGDGARLPEFINSGVASVVSEYGSTIADRPGKYEPGWW